ncbi:class I SAM-dependent methyltransferase [Ktedonosporobacter rubrisoli]|uniref:Class I SAM-dependent methyltransferase n=1 Tax=Ktedonosporobacter rubrisoli TaxID=2509675 RepID=A0A4P6JP94_KTERU|nr:class I SAM-dependent methyltransferase [Ktedonosporobacter rubrisoli]QBD77188.1 class I SAM-dependent methyltransferase [Ktedonosporobacter rubrisoli]
MTTNITYQMENLYRPFLSQQYGELANYLQQSHAPRSDALMYEVAAQLGIGEHSAVLDVGTGCGPHAIELARRLGCHVTGVDIAATSLKEACRRVEELDMRQQITFLQGDILALPFASDTFDLLVCCGVLEHIKKLPQAFQECARVLKPSGKMLIMATLATELLEPSEATYLYKNVQLVPENMSPTTFEAMLTAAHFVIYSREFLGSETYEYLFERELSNTHPLLQLSRLRRLRTSCEAQFGDEACRTMELMSLWYIYHFLGKLASVFYVVECKQEG